MSALTIPYQFVEPLAPIGNNEVLGNISGNTALPVGLTGSQVTDLLNIFTSLKKGLVPQGTGASTDYLGGDAAFHPLVIPPPPTWTQAYSQVVSGSAIYAVTGLSGYQEIIIIVGGAADTFGRIGLLTNVSTNNGSTWITSGAYIRLQNDGTAIAANSILAGQNTGGSGGNGNCFVRLAAFNKAMFSPYQYNGDSSNNAFSGYINLTSAFNAIQITSQSGLAWTGAITVLGLTG